MADSPPVGPEIDRLRAELGIAEHERALIEADTHRGITDASTPLFQRVRNIVESLEKAEADVARLTQERDAALQNVADFTNEVISRDRREKALAAEVARLTAARAALNQQLQSLIQKWRQAIYPFSPCEGEHCLCAGADELAALLAAEGPS